MEKLKGCITVLAALCLVYQAQAGKLHQEFLSKMTPAVLEANYSIMLEREKLLIIQDQYIGTGFIGDDQLAYLAVLGEKYEMKNYTFQNTAPALMLAEMMEELSTRVDVIPVQLVLAQSIIETGWGKSRSAQATHNFFGITSSSGGSSYVVTSHGETVYYLMSYNSDAEGILAYIMLLNTKLSYAELRAIRAEKRKKGEVLDATALSAGLMKYSELGQVYIDKINFVIGKYLSGEDFAGTPI